LGLHFSLKSWASTLFLFIMSPFVLSCSNNAYVRLTSLYILQFYSYMKFETVYARFFSCYLFVVWKLNHIPFNVTSSWLHSYQTWPGSIGQPGTRGLDRVCFIQKSSLHLARRKPFYLPGQLETRIIRQNPIEIWFFSNMFFP
jgi:hypothetical protein